jgi:hypothetical protein
MNAQTVPQAHTDKGGSCPGATRAALAAPVFTASDRGVHFGPIRVFNTTEIRSQGERARAGDRAHGALAGVGGLGAAAGLSGTASPGVRGAPGRTAGARARGSGGALSAGILAGLPDIEAMEVVERFFEVGATVVGTPNPVGIFLAGCRECLAEWEVQVARGRRRQPVSASEASPDLEQCLRDDRDVDGRLYLPASAVCPRGQTCGVEVPR